MTRDGIRSDLCFIADSYFKDFNHSKTAKELKELFEDIKKNYDALCIHNKNEYDSIAVHDLYVNLMNFTDRYKLLRSPISKRKLILDFLIDLIKHYWIYIDFHTTSRYARTEITMCEENFKKDFGQER